MYMKDSIKLLKALSDASGISGFEDDVIEVIRSVEPDRFTVEEDKMRNAYIRFADAELTDNELTIMLDAHSDEVGFIVQSIQNNGLLRFLPVGGWIPANASAQKVRVGTRDGNEISGIISSKPPHFMSEEERQKPPSFDSLFIDVGASSRAEAEETFGIEVGAPVVPDVALEYIEQNDRVIGKAFDNRMGCACVLETMKRLGGAPKGTNVVGAIASQEEVGTRGAVLTARKVKPDVAIVFEGTPADDSFRGEDAAQAVLGKGPQIRHMDKSMITSPRFVKFARAVAKAEKIPFQDAVRKGGGTNGGPIHLSEEGIPTIVLGVPVRYVHTHYGIASVFDYDACVDWAVKIIKTLTREDYDAF